MTKKNIDKNSIINKWLKKKGWSLYKHQKEVITNLGLGKNILLNAPTGTGKTLGGFLPIFNDLLSNKGKKLMQLIEVQYGDYLGEDDIIRLEDRYNRN